jgi:3-hydroxyisobutyrate dehydrogenase-like beta-hydroxyacid dehydrogenase
MRPVQSSTVVRLSSIGTALLDSIQQRRARAGVVGLGYVGLPLAVEFGRAGLQVTGIELDQRKVDAVEGGTSYVPDVPTSAVRELRDAGRLHATTDFSVIRELDTINICVPTPLRKTKDPDMSFVVAAAEQIAKYVHPGLLVVLESTTYPGTTAELLKPMLESTGLRVGEDVFLAFSPERVDPSNQTFNTKNTPKVVGGVTPACSQIASALYATAIDTIVPVSSTQVAEMVKLLENTFRAVNIGLVNELALMCDRLGLSVWEVVDAGVRSRRQEGPPDRGGPAREPRRGRGPSRGGHGHELRQPGAVRRVRRDPPRRADTAGLRRARGDRRRGRPAEARGPRDPTRRHDAGAEGLRVLLAARDLSR